MTTLANAAPMEARSSKGSMEGDSGWFEPKWVFAASLSVRRPGGAGDLRREPLKLAATTEPRSRVEVNVAPRITQVRPCTLSSAAKTCPPPESSAGSGSETGRAGGARPRRRGLKESGSKFRRDGRSSAKEIDWRWRRACACSWFRAIAV